MGKIYYLMGKSASGKDHIYENLIQETALDLFDREGFENVSVEEIAQAAGCSVGNIYHYFKSKDELIIQVTSNVDAQYQLLEQSYLADNASSARSKLLDFVGKSLDISSKDPALYRSFIHGLKYPEQAILQDNESRVYFRVLRELIAACQQKVEFFGLCACIGGRHDDFNFHSGLLQNVILHFLVNGAVTSCLCSGYGESA